MSDWIIRHPHGYWSRHESGDLPKLRQDAKHSIAVVFGDEGQVDEVREWTGRSWKMLTGEDKDFALDWLRS